GTTRHGALAPQRCSPRDARLARALRVAHPARERPAMNGLRTPPDPVLEQVLRRWLRDEAPDGAPRQLFERVVDAATTGAQRRTWRDTLRIPARPGTSRAVIAALAFVVLP